MPSSERRRRVSRSAQQDTERLKRSRQVNNTSAEIQLDPDRLAAALAQQEAQRLELEKKRIAQRYELSPTSPETEATLGLIEVVKTNSWLNRTPTEREILIEDYFSSFPPLSPGLRWLREPIFKNSQGSISLESRPRYGQIISDALGLNRRLPK